MLIKEDQPEYKIIDRGSAALTNAELLSLIIGGGAAKSLQLAKDVLTDNDNKFHKLSRCSVSQLTKYKGITPRKAISIIAMLEMTRRKYAEIIEPSTPLNSSKKMFDLLRTKISDYDHELFSVIYLSRANKVISFEILSKGGITGVVVDPRLIFKRAFELGAVALVLAHNHPSGSIMPSKADEALTENLRQIGNLMDIPILDHLIIAHDAYYSFSDEGQLYR
jgi:DNA repair protein RadC